MKEDLLHFIWKYKKYPITNLRTTQNESVIVETVGIHNQLSGPDFFNSKVTIGGQLWAGNVEVHINSSDWYAHHHEQDSHYDNVILHVVWEDDVSVFRADGSVIPTLELKSYISKELLGYYLTLFQKKSDKFINCEKDIKEVSQFILDNWLERLYFERLEQKSKVILALLKDSQNDWEKVLFVLLLKNFGSKINGDVFFEMGKRLDFSIIRKLYQQPQEMESLFLGFSGLLDSETISDGYYLDLKKDYAFLRNKYGLEEALVRPAFFKLRPSNFPTIRLSQLANLYSSSTNLFHEIIASNSTDFYEFFKIKTSDYWENHYTFGKVSKSSKKRLSRKFVDLLIINTIVPLRFCYLKAKGMALDDSFVKGIKSIAKEDNSIVRNYQRLGVLAANAKDSQALLQLNANYCTKDKCLQCAIGAELLNLKS